MIQFSPSPHLLFVVVAIIVVDDDVVMRALTARSGLTLFVRALDEFVVIGAAFVQHFGLLAPGQI